MADIPGRTVAAAAADLLVGPASVAVCWGCLRNLKKA
jgi:hypothetical protein